MAYETLSSVNTTEGMHTLFVYANVITTGWFMRLVLLGLFCVALFGSFYARRTELGQGDIAISFVVASFITLVGSVVLSLIPGLIDMFTVGLIIGVFAISLLFLFLGRNTTA